MMGIRACANVSTSTELGARRQINHFAHYLPRQGVGTAYMLRGSAQLEHISAVFGYSGLINSQDRYEEEFSLYMGYFI